MTNLVMGLCTDMTDTQRQSGLRALQGLNLALLIATEHEGFIGRRQIQPDDVPEFLFKVRVVGQLEGACQVRFYVVGGPYPLDAEMPATRAMLRQLQRG